MTTLEKLLSRPAPAISFAAMHPWVVYDVEGRYDSRFTSEQLAREHAWEVGGTIEYEPRHEAARG